MIHRKKIIFLISVIVFALVTGQTVSLSQADQWLHDFNVLFSSEIPTTTQSQAASEWHTVSRVIDGDTIEIDTGERVRYIGIDAPESVKPDNPVECFGREASGYNKQLVEGKRARFEGDVSDRDTYGRLLRFVYLEDETFINDKLVRDGYAYADAFPPDVTKADEFKQAQREAKDAGRGLWAETTCKRKK